MSATSPTGAPSWHESALAGTSDGAVVPPPATSWIVPAPMGTPAQVAGALVSLIAWTVATLFPSASATTTQPPA